MFSSNRNTLITGGSSSAFERLEEATAHAGFHNSIERSDSPRCYSQTRLAILARISARIARKDNSNTCLMWLSGDAGAGKFAVMQSLAEQCEKEGRLSASFFFRKSNPSRNDSRKLIATIAYQMCINTPGVRGFILDAIDYDPLIFTNSLTVQIKTLVIDPLHQLQDIGNIDASALYLIIIMVSMSAAIVTSSATS